MKHKTDACGCCEGVEKLTPLPTANRPGLPQLLYRVGTHASFLETMLARLSTHYLEVPPDRNYPIQALKTRLPEDPAIAMLDSWATVADVLTFYQERIANEGYIRTATERRSVLELARLVGYKLRPGVSSSVFLAYTLDDNFKDEVVIPKGARAQSVPGPGEMPQTFETSEDLKARAMWNNLKPRRTQPQTISKDSRRLYLKGINTNLKANDLLLMDFGKGKQTHFRVSDVKPDAAADRTLITLQAGVTSPSSGKRVNQSDLIKALMRSPSAQRANSLRLDRSIAEQFSKTSGTGYGAVSTFAPVLRETLALAAAKAKVTNDNTIKVYAFRVKASLFGNNAPKKPDRFDGNRILQTKEWDLSDIKSSEEIDEEDKTCAAVFLDAGYHAIVSGSWIIIDSSAFVDKDTAIKKASKGLLIAKASNPQADIARSVYGISGKTTRIELIDPDTSESKKSWFSIAGTGGRPNDFQIIRRTVVYAQSEELELAEEPVETSVCGGTEDPLELDGFYDGLESGRWVIVSGERDIAGTSGVRFSEVAMIASVEHAFKDDLPGDKTHTFIKLAENLQYCFTRDTVTIYGNVVKATHGETRKEVLGSGDGAKALQSFTLKQPPLTFVSAPNPSGVDSTLKVTINDVEWHETDSLAGLLPTDRSFITRTDDEGKITVNFGNGREGARLPTGIENVKAEYRNGIGKPGNVKAGQLSLLITRPLGVKEVANPLRASGGADRENRDQARKNAPLAVRALDRLVSVQDYEDFARTYAGIGKARAMELSDGRRQVVHVTIAGADDIPIDETSDLFQNLRRALHDFGDPYQPVRLAVRELKLIVISAGVRILPDYQWESVVTQLRAALLDAFSFERRELGQDVLLSEVISVMQAVRGVAYVDVDVFGGIPEKNVKEVEELINGKKVMVKRRLLLTPEEIAEKVQNFVKTSQEKGRPKPRLTVNLADYEEGVIRPAQLAFLTPDVPATLILNQIM